MATLFLDLYGVLVDSAVIEPAYNERFSAILRRHFGGDLATWCRVQAESYDWYRAQLAELDRRDGPEREGDPWVRAVWDLNAGQVRYVLDRMGVPLPHDLLRFAEATEEETVRGIDGTFPEVKSVLRRLRGDGHRLFLSTNANRSNAESALVGGGIRELFDGLLMLETAKAKKDRPAYWRTALKDADADPADSVVVDDLLPFLVTAASEGLRCVQVLRGHRPRNRTTFPTIDSLEALPPLLG